jgi:hypothetical protein
MGATSPVTRFQLAVMAVGYALTGTGYFGPGRDATRRT